MNRLLIPILVMTLSMSAVAQADQLVATNSDVRMVLGFAAPAEAVARLLPQGWESDVATSGPAKDINLRVTFIETLIVRDADGKPLAAPRIAHLSLPARRTGAPTVATMLVVAYSTGGAGGPYGNSVAASAILSRRTAPDAVGQTVVEERWQFRTVDGQALDAHIEYVRGTPTVVQVEDRVHSAARPHFYRIYRTEQARESLRTADPGRVRRFAFSASGPLLSQVFDGSERLISIDALHWYARHVYLPGSQPPAPPKSDH